MSESIDALLTLAEVGIGLAGFAGIVVALTKREAPLTSAHVLLVRELILNSLAVVLLALLPAGLALLGSHGAGVWRGVSSLHAVLIVLVAWPSLVLQVRGIPAEQRDPVTYLVSGVLGATAVVLQFLNASALLFPPSGGVYFFGVCVGPLAIGAVHFVRVLFARLL